MYLQPKHSNITYVKEKHVSRKSTCKSNPKLKLVLTSLQNCIVRNCCTTLAEATRYELSHTNRNYIAFPAGCVHTNNKRYTQFAAIMHSNHLKQNWKRASKLELGF